MELVHFVVIVGFCSGRLCEWGPFYSFYGLVKIAWGFLPAPLIFLLHLQKFVVFHLCPLKIKLKLKNK